MIKESQLHVTDFSLLLALNGWTHPDSQSFHFLHLEYQELHWTCGVFRTLGDKQNLACSAIVFGPWEKSKSWFVLAGCYNTTHEQIPECSPGTGVNTRTRRTSKINILLLVSFFLFYFFKFVICLWKKGSIWNLNKKAPNETDTYDFKWLFFFIWMFF